MSDKKQRLFNETELAEMGEETVNLIEQAIDAGELDKAKILTRKMHRESFRQHEVFRDWITSLLSYIYRHLGDDAVYESTYEVLAQLPIFTNEYRDQDLGHQAAVLASNFRGHLTPVVVEEDDEKFTIMMSPCGSGGRSIASGSYETSKNFAKVKKPQKMTFARGDFPIYCTHCALQELVPIEKLGYPLWVTEIPDKIGYKPCKYHIYKDPDNIPAKYYERYGLKKPVPQSNK